jgi:putative membrane protein
MRVVRPQNAPTRPAWTRYQRALAAGALAVWAIAAINPVDRPAWLLENVMLLVAVSWLVWSQRRWPLSNLSHTFIFAFMVLHIAGTHYTYSQVPVGAWAQQAFGLGRNHYDRVVHFLFGLVMFYPWREQAMRAAGLRGSVGSLVALLIVGTCSAGYEVAEWIAAEMVDPRDAVAYLGTQGDPFDTQKDMAVALLGATLAVFLIEGPAWLRRLRGKR